MDQYGTYRVVFWFCRLVFGHFEIQELSPVNWHFQRIPGILAAITYKWNFGIISTESGDKFPVHKHRSAVHIHVATSWFASRHGEIAHIIANCSNWFLCHFSAVSKLIELIFSVLDTGHSIWSVSKIWFYFKTTFIFKTSENQTTKLEKYSVVGFLLHSKLMSSYNA